MYVIKWIQWVPLIGLSVQVMLTYGETGLYIRLKSECVEW